MTYYLVTDVGTQWFHYLVRVDGDKTEYWDMASLNHASSTLLSNVYGREVAFTYREFKGMPNDFYYGWSISETEFKRIHRMLELSPSVAEFNRVKDSV